MNNLRNKAAKAYCEQTVTLMGTGKPEELECMDDEAVVHNLRFMAFCAGWDAANNQPADGGS